MTTRPPPESPVRHIRRLVGTDLPPRGPVEYRWVYLWGVPLRLMHWAAAASIVTLIVTGFFIGAPYFLSNSTSPLVMSRMRLVHFAAAAVLVATAIVRMYWLLAGNRFERWRALFPVRPRDWGNLLRQVKFYLMIQPEKAPRYLGHNPLQQWSYTGIFVVALVMVCTGFALYGLSNPQGIFFRAFGWVHTLLGGAQGTRFVHHVLTWVFIIFIPVHIYLASRADVWEHQGSISSIISGGRFVPEHEEFVDE